ncbi:unnamed protein product [Natator depressus]
MAQAQQGAMLWHWHTGDEVPGTQEAPGPGVGRGEVRHRTVALAQGTRRTVAFRYKRGGIRAWLWHTCAEAPGHGDGTQEAQGCGIGRGEAPGRGDGTRKAPGHGHDTRESLGHGNGTQGCRAMAMVHGSHWDMAMAQRGHRAVGLEDRSVRI